jgi:hypothetical protein
MASRACCAAPASYQLHFPARVQRPTTRGSSGRADDAMGGGRATGLEARVWRDWGRRVMRGLEGEVHGTGVGAGQGGGVIVVTIIRTNANNQRQLREVGGGQIETVPRPRWSRWR